MKTLPKRLLTLVVSLLLIGFVVLQLYPMFYSSVTTETVYSYSAYETLNVDCVAIRNETPIALNTSNYVFYTVQNGTRVANGGTIAEFYSSHADALNKQKIDSLQSEIEALKETQTVGSGDAANLDILNTQIKRTMTELVQNSSAATLGDMTDLRYRLGTLINKKHIVTGKSADFTARIAALQKEMQSLQASFKQSVGAVKAPVAGYFVNEVDGLENVLTVKTVQDMTPDNVRTALKTPANGNSSSFAGKIVSDYAWYLACVVPNEYATTLGVGKTLRVRLPFVTDEEVPVTVVGCNKDASGEVAVIFECVNMSEALSSIRLEKMEILLVEHKGLRVPKRAITTNGGQEIGVYIRSGDLVRFRKIEQEYSDAADYVICKQKDETGYLHLYDDIITAGRNLYDGKLIR